MGTRRKSRRGITIADVAQEAKVSTQTVSRVLNGKDEISASTRGSVMAVIERMGYRPNSVARSLVTSRTFAIGLSVPDIRNPFFPEIARGAEDVAREKGYEMFLCNTAEDSQREEDVLRTLEDRRVDGAIICSPRLPDEKLLPWLQSQPAAVLVNRPSPLEIVGSVRVDDASGTRRAVHHLLGNGRETIGFLSGPPGSHSGKERARGFREALSAVGSGPDPDLIVPCMPDSGGGYESAFTLLSEHRNIGGLICYNDLVAVGALRACAELGLGVPEDVAVVGCDDIMIAGLVSPALTTLRAPKYEIGAYAARMLLESAGGGDMQAEIILKPELVVRASTPQAGVAG